MGGNFMIIGAADTEMHDIFRLFYDIEPLSFETINTSRGDSDFREVIIAKTANDKKYIVKLADNDFTFPEKIEMWKRTSEEYRKLGYYCPAIVTDKNGIFPYIHYKDHNCIAYGEEYAPYEPVETRNSNASINDAVPKINYEEDAWIMTAKIAAKHLDYTSYPSGFCLFDTFCPSDETDEVLENALSWKSYAEKLPEKFREQTQRIWMLWEANRKELEPIYKTLPTSVFQADLNPSNILVDTTGKFMGVYDFNLCGKEVFLNYLFREIYCADFAREIAMIKDTLQLVSKYYQFSDCEKNTASMLYKCIKPLWYNRLQALKKLKDNSNAIKKLLDETEYYLTQNIDFSNYMN